MFLSEDVKSTIQNVAMSISAAMDVEIMVVDDNRRIVGGTVSPEKTYFVSQIYDYVMETKTFFLLEDPGRNEVCVGCRFYGCCKELVELDAPILLEGNCVGILSVTAFREEHRRHILRKKEDYSLFLINMANLIAGKIGEEIAKDRLKKTALRLSAIINSINEGMLAVDEHGIIIHCNRLAECILQVERKQLLNQRWGQFFRIDEGQLEKNVRIRQQETILYRGDGKEIPCYISMNPIADEEGMPQGTVLSIDDVGEVKKLVGSIMGYTRKDFNFSDIIGNSRQIMEVKQRGLKASTTDSTLLIRGESGTGKELFARAAHNCSRRSNAPFVALNCAAIPDSLLESELFGYEAGAFTGANKGGKLGKFELADGGTIFLDEIGDMPIYLQAKLLRVLQEKSIQRIGGVKEKGIDIRIISATNKDLERLVAENRFREDLFYRLNVVPLRIPPLRMRMEDIPLLIQYFLEKYNVRLKKSILGIEEETQRMLMEYQWPGNVRELENVIEYAMNMEAGVRLSVASLPESVRQCTPKSGCEDGRLKALLCRYEAQLLGEKLRQYGRTLEAKRRIARELDVSMATLYRKLRDLQLE